MVTIDTISTNSFPKIIYSHNARLLLTLIWELANSLHSFYDELYQFQALVFQEVYLTLLQKRKPTHTII
jgi:hypothetical protein